MPDTAPFTTVNFMVELRAWMRREDPSTRLVATVAEWEPALCANPYRDADLDGEHLLFRVVPGTGHDGRMVTLSYSVHGAEVRCHSFRCQKIPADTLFELWPPEPHDHER